MRSTLLAFARSALVVALLSTARGDDPTAGKAPSDTANARLQSDSELSDGPSKGEPDNAKKLAADSLLGTEPGQLRDDNESKLKLVWCPPGSLTREIQVEQITRTRTGTRTLLKVTPVKKFVTRGYWLGKYEVTQAEWKQVMGTEPWKGQRFTEVGDDCPATYVSWDDAASFCRKLTEQERSAGRLPDGWAYTLPTEVQWERACRAETKSVFSFGDDESQIGEYAWHNANTWNAGERYAHRVGQKKPNPWGLCDVHGNVWEWCQDFHAEKLEGARDTEITESSSSRIVRGGGWSFAPVDCRSANRLFQPGAGDHDIGFRVALSQ